MEEVKYFRRFHQANMSHLISILNKSKWALLIVIFTKLFFEENVYAALGVLISFAILAVCTAKLEQSVQANDRTVILIMHFII